MGRDPFEDAKRANYLPSAMRVHGVCYIINHKIVFTLKYRRKIIYNKYKKSFREILKQLCGYKGVEILERHVIPDQVNMHSA